MYRGDLPAAIRAMEATQDILSTVPQPESGLALELRLSQLIALGLATGLVVDHNRADTCLAEVLAITDACGETHFRFYALWAQALSSWRQGKAHDTATALTAALRLRQAEASTDRSGVARSIEAMAWIAASQHQYQRAATLIGAADALWTETGTPGAKRADIVDHHRACERRTRAELGDGAFTAAVAHGQSLSYHDAIAYALNEQRQQPAQRPSEASNPLTRREREVADLIADGLSNREIASKLVISQRTAESHVEHILTKLGFTRRAQVAAFRAAQRPGAQDP